MPRGSGRLADRRTTGGPVGFKAVRPAVVGAPGPAAATTMPTFTIVAKFSLGTVGGQSAFSRGAIAIDFGTGRLRMVGPNSAGNPIWDYTIPAENTWNPTTPTALARTATRGHWISTGGDSEIYPAGIAYYGSDWWLISKKQYDSAPPATTTLYSELGSTNTLTLDRQKFAGFIKRYGQDPLIGCGGTQSGQGAALGICIGDLSSTKFMTWTYGTLVFEQRQERNSDYYTAGHVDGFQALDPANHGGSGCWASDQVKGGGVQVGNRLLFWPWQGHGLIDYAYQTELLSDIALSKTSVYVIDATTKTLVTYDHWGSVMHVLGQDVDSLGRIYVARNDAFDSANVEVWVYTLTG